MVEGKKSTDEIFRRDISVSARWMGDDTILISGHLKDKYHEMTSEIKFSFPALEILDVRGALIKYPHNECVDSVKFLERLKGIRVSRNFYAKIMEMTGGPFGCVHINNLIYEMGMSAVQARFARFDELAPPDFEKIPKPRRIKIYLEWMPGIKNGCTAWAEDSPMVKEAEGLKD